MVGSALLAERLLIDFRVGLRDTPFMGVKTAAVGQAFHRPEFAMAKLVMRSLFVLLGLAAAAAVANPEYPAIAITAGCVGLVLSMLVRLFGEKRASEDPALLLFWKANSFSFFLMGSLLIPGGIYLNAFMAARVVVSGVAGLSLLAGIVGFCAGRFLYLFVLGGDGPQVNTA